MKITIKENAQPGEYYLRARARLSDNTINDDTWDILVSNLGVSLKIGRWDPIISENGISTISATVANLTSTKIENGQIHSKIFSGETVIDDEWGGNTQIVNLGPGEIKNYYFEPRIKNNVPYENYHLRVKLDAENLTWIQTAKEDFEPGTVENLDTESCSGNVKLSSSITNHLVISEIQIDSINGSGGTYDDWIELYNPTSENIDLATESYRIERATSSGGDPGILMMIGNTNDGSYPGGTVIPAYGYYLIVRDDANADLQNIADAIGTKSNFTLTDSNVIYLGTGPISGPTDPDMVDFVGYGNAPDYEGTSSATQPPDGGSIERKSNAGGVTSDGGNGHDTDNNADDFVTRSPAEPQNHSDPAEAPSPNYASSGQLTSSVHDAGEVVSWTIISWDATIPTGTNLTLETRASADNVTWSYWQACENNSQLSSSDNRYLQYRAMFSTTDETVTPTLHEMRITYTRQTLAEDVKEVRVIPRKFFALEEWRNFRGDVSENVQQFVWLAKPEGGAENLIKLNEIYANVAGTDQGNEWIEIYNTSEDITGQEVVDISGWKVIDDEGTIAKAPKNTILRPDEYYVFENFTSNMLNNAGENIWLRNKEGENIDFIDYTSTIEGKSLARTPNGTGNWVENAELTKCRNNDDNSAGTAENFAVKLEKIRAKASSLKQRLLEGLENTVLLDVKIHDALQYIDQHEYGIPVNRAKELVRYIQSLRRFPENYRLFMKENLNIPENLVPDLENLIIQHSDLMVDSLTEYGLNLDRLRFKHSFDVLVSAVASSLHIEIASRIETQPQDQGISPEQYLAELGNRWETSSSDLTSARGLDNSLYEAMKDNNWQAAHDNADNLMNFAENRSLELVDEIHLARIAREYFRDNGTSDNVENAAEMELRFTKALDRFIYWYQKGLYYKMVTFGALNGDNEAAIDKATEVRNLPFTTDNIQSKNYVTVEELLSNPSAHDNENVWVMGFVSNIQKKVRTDGGEFTLFDLSTHEYSDNTQQKLGVFFAWGYINVGYGAGENSYTKLYGEFHEFCETENGPDLHARGVELFSDADIVPDNTPWCWELLEPWKTPAYVEFAFTRRWGAAQYFEPELKNNIEGAIDIGYEVLGDTWRNHELYVEGIDDELAYIVIHVLLEYYESKLDVEHNYGPDGEYYHTRDADDMYHYYNGRGDYYSDLADYGIDPAWDADPMGDAFADAVGDMMGGAEGC